MVADAWSLPAWVVGAARIDAVAAGWPQEGSLMAYRAGAWPLLLRARTEVTSCVFGEQLALHGDLGRAGAVDLQLMLRAHGSGCEIVMREDITAGPGRSLPRAVEAALLTGRNAETLRRLALLAERPSRLEVDRL